MKEFEAQFLDKYVNLIGGSNFLIPTLAKAFAAQAGAGTMEIRANSTLTHKISGAKALAFGVPGSSDASNTATNLSRSIANNPITLNPPAVGRSSASFCSRLWQVWYTPSFTAARRTTQVTPPGKRSAAPLVRSRLSQQRRLSRVADP